MSIQSAMQAGVAGLTVQSRKFATISDNIANSETGGYKRASTAFSSQVIDGGSRTTYTAGGVTTTVMRAIDRSGAIKGATNSTDLAVNGGGFFLVKSGLPANQANEPPLLTRVGNASLDKDGYLRLASGLYLQGMALDETGAPVGSGVNSVRIDQQPSTPTPSTDVGFKANLPTDLAGQGAASALTTTASYVDELGTTRDLRFRWTPAAAMDLDLTFATPVANNGTLDFALGGSPINVNLGAAASTSLADMAAQIDAALPADASAAVVGGKIRISDTQGRAITGLAYTPGTGPGDALASSAVAANDTWQLQIFDDATSKVTPAYSSVLTFDNSGPNAGRLTAGMPATVTLAGINGQALEVNLDLTQYDYSYAPTPSTDGIPVSDFAGVEVGEDGTVYSVYKNGSRTPAFRLAMGDVTNPAGLRPEANNAFATTIASGDLLTRFAGEGSVGTIQAFALEGSNVDIAEELTSMITTQRIYTANASIITTSDEMLEEAVRLKR